MTTIRVLRLLLVLAVPAMASRAQAAELRMTVERPHFTCEGHATLLNHAAWRPDAAGTRALLWQVSDAIDPGAPLPCCDGQIGCAQFLSTNTILHPERRLRG